MARQTDKLFGNIEYVCVTHKGLKMVTVPISSRRSLGLSLDRSADSDKIIPKIMAKFAFGPILWGVQVTLTSIENGFMESKDRV